MEQLKELAGSEVQKGEDNWFTRGKQDKREIGLLENSSSYKLSLIHVVSGYIPMMENTSIK